MTIVKVKLADTWIAFVPYKLFFTSYIELKKGVTDRIVRPTLSGFSKYDKALTVMMVTWRVQIGLKEYMNKYYCFNYWTFRRDFFVLTYEGKVQNREDKTIESAIPFPAPEKGDNGGLSPFHPRKIIVIRECPLLSSEAISLFVPFPVPCLPKNFFLGSPETIDSFFHSLPACLMTAWQLPNNCLLW